MTILTTHNPIHPLPSSTAAELMNSFINQDTDPLLVGACLVLLAQREPTSEELAAFSESLAKSAIPFPASPQQAVDTCGTGGDGSSSANLSTLAAFLLAHLGVPVVKHGNRAATSFCGSADLLEELGYDLNRTSSQLSDDLKSHHFAFLYAPVYYPLLGRLREIRKRLGIPTIFNLLGPLLNPAKPSLQVLGVARDTLLEPIAGALASRKTLHRAFVIHGKDAEGKGMDEASIEGPTLIKQVRRGSVLPQEVIVPRELGISVPQRNALKVKDRDEALQVARGILGGAHHPDFRPSVADAVALQAALGLLLHRDLELTDLASVFQEARRGLESGFAIPFIPLGVKS